MGKIKTFLTAWAAGFAGLAILVSLTSFALHMAAWFAFLGNPPAFPWFLWRMFIALSFLGGAVLGVAALFRDGDRP